MTESPSTPGPADPLSTLAETPVERTASEAHPEAIPPVAGAADPQVLATGVSDRPLARSEDADEAVRDAGAAAAAKADGDKSGDGETKDGDEKSDDDQ